MKKVYLSSTFEDLVEYRERAVNALQKLDFHVVAMESYVATDARPVDKCLADVAEADLYVGLFAFRYGHVPEDDNPDRRSITEMEYRHARTCGIDTLIFLVPDSAMWRPASIDAHTGNGERGDRIKALRAALAKEHTVGEFRTPNDIGEAVATAAARWMQTKGLMPPAAASPSGVPHPRQIRSDLLLLHAEADRATAAALVAELKGVWAVETSATGLLAGSGEELVALDRAVAAVRSVAVLLSPTSVTLLAEDRARSRRVLGLARDRANVLLGVAPVSVETDASLPFVDVVGPPPGDASDATRTATALHVALSQHFTPGKTPEVGLPMVVVAMTAGEAGELVTAPPAAVAPLLDAMGGADEVMARYGPTRLDWRPFGRGGETVQQVLDAAVVAANSDMDRTQGRRIRLQPYPLDALLDDPLLTHLVYEDVARVGCLVVADELSMFHRAVRDAYMRSRLDRGRQVALVTLSPLDPGAGSPYAPVREQIDGFLADAARRFEEVLDPLCELNVPERRRLARWLHGSLPRAVDALREARRDPGKLNAFAEEMGRRANPTMARMIAGGSGTS